MPVSKRSQTNSTVTRPPPANDRPRVLTPSHLADLRASGLSDATIAACKFHSLTDPALVKELLNWRRYDGELGDCLAFPYFDADGKFTSYVRMKPGCPLVNRGKRRKYESPKGEPNRVYIPPGTCPALASLTDLLITEGEKKAAKASQEGFACIGLVGVWGWCKKRERNIAGKPLGNFELIDDLAAIPWQ